MYFRLVLIAHLASSVTTFVISQSYFKSCECRESHNAEKNLGGGGEGGGGEGLFPKVGNTGISFMHCRYRI